MFPPQARYNRTSIGKRQKGGNDDGNVLDVVVGVIN
jgi:hypothetical protein